MPFSSVKACFLAALIAAVVLIVIDLTQNGGQHLWTILGIALAALAAGFLLG